uniref:Uncharacterized protein n=1 Tax=Arundo donax TaxID=35708 RepID=A0A0A9EBK3_ARUDO
MELPRLESSEILSHL